MRSGEAASAEWCAVSGAPGLAAMCWWPTSESSSSSRSRICVPVFMHAQSARTLPPVLVSVTYWVIDPSSTLHPNYTIAFPVKIYHYETPFKTLTPKSYMWRQFTGVLSAEMC